MAEVSEVLKGMSMLDKVANFCVLIGEEATVKIFSTFYLKTLLRIYQLI